MPIRDTEAMCKSLDNDYGPTAGASAPPSHELVMYRGDPLAEGVEVVEAGRATIMQDDWLPTSADGYKRTDGLVSLPDPTEPWSADFYALVDPDGYMWDATPLEKPMDVEVGGDTPQVLVEIFYDDSTQEG